MYLLKLQALSVERSEKLEITTGLERSLGQAPSEKSDFDFIRTLKLKGQSKFLGRIFSMRKKWKCSKTKFPFSKTWTTPT
jgi:hypothetical protein